MVKIYHFGDARPLNPIEPTQMVSAGGNEEYIQLAPAFVLKESLKHIDYYKLPLYKNPYPGELLKPPIPGVYPKN